MSLRADLLKRMCLPECIVSLSYLGKSLENNPPGTKLYKTHLNPYHGYFPVWEHNVIQDCGLEKQYYDLSVNNT